VRRIVLFAALAVALQVSPAAAQSDDWWFKTPGGAAYCRLETGAFLCMRPSDGFWIRLTRIFGRHADVRTGSSGDFRGFDGPAATVLGFGRVFYSSDAAAITCSSRKTGLTCKQIEGLSFTLGRERGHRIFYDAPGFPPNVQPLFRSSHGVLCGIDRENLEPSNPLLDCWRPADGLVLGIAHDSAGNRGSHGRSEKAHGFRPPGFRPLASEDTFQWRCRDVTARLAERCSTSAGTPVFTCTSTRTRLTCRNRSGHGFWASARSFYTF
jgi:hypothetical protein